jgi:hypothetical protein
MHTDLAIMDVSIVNFSLALSFGAILWLIVRVNGCLHAQRRINFC